MTSFRGGRSCEGGIWEWYGSRLFSAYHTLLGALELFLAGRKSRWPGLVLPVLLLFLLVPMTISTASVYFPIPIMNYSYGDETLDNVKIYYGVIYDKEGKGGGFQ